MRSIRYTNSKGSKISIGDNSIPSTLEDGIVGCWKADNIPEWPDNPAGTAYLQGTIPADSWSGWGVGSNGAVSLPGNGILRFTSSGGNGSTTKTGFSFSGSTYNTVRLKLRASKAMTVSFLWNTTGTSRSVACSCDTNWKLFNIDFTGKSWAETITQLYLYSDLLTSGDWFESQLIYIGNGTYSTPLIDLSGNGYHATINGCTPVPGPKGKDLSLDGINDSFAFDNPMGTGAFTLEIPITTTVDTRFLCGQNGAAGNRQLFLYVGSLVTAHKLNLRLYADGTNGIDFVSLSSVDTGVRKYVTIVFVPSTSVSFYIDGLLDNVVTASVPASLFKSTAQFVVGGTSAFNGTLTPPRIFPRALSAAEVKAIYTSRQKTTIPTGETAYGMVESVEGDDQVDIEVQQTRAPYQDGGTYIDALANVRSFVVNGKIKVPVNLDTIQTQRKAILDVLNAKYGTGTLDYFYGVNQIKHRVLRDVAVERVQFKNKEFRYPYQEFQVSFTAFDPYWEDPLSDGSGATAISGTPITFTVGGENDSWPTIRIYGASTNPALSHSSGKVLSLTYSLAGGSYIDIDTRFGSRTIKLNGSTSLIGKLDIGSSFFALTPGSNTITMSGGGYAVIIWRGKYIGV